MCAIDSFLNTPYGIIGQRNAWHRESQSENFKKGLKAANDKMLDRRAITVAILPLLLAAGHASAQTRDNAPQCCTSGNAPSQNDKAMSAAEIHDLMARALESQRKDDAALMEYERTEHSVTKGNGKDVPDKDVVTRIIPTGVDVVHIEISRNGKPTDAAILEQQWRGLEKMLQIESHPEDPLAKLDYEHALKRRRERAEMIEAFAKAFTFHWVGRSTLGNTTVVEFSFEPDPEYKPSIRYGNLFAHAHGKIWLEETSAHVVRFEAQLNSDVSFGGGVFAKVYRGGHFTFEQMEVAPGMWLPKRSTYDFDGRKFVFGMSVHEEVQETEYRHVGPPEQALLLVRREHPGAH